MAVAGTCIDSLHVYQGVWCICVVASGYKELYGAFEIVGLWGNKSRLSKYKIRAQWAYVKDTTSFKRCTRASRYGHAVYVCMYWSCDDDAWGDSETESYLLSK